MSTEAAITDPLQIAQIAQIALTEYRAERSPLDVRQTESGEWAVFRGDQRVSEPFEFMTEACLERISMEALA